jgi:hypothetical protein
MDGNYALTGLCCHPDVRSQRRSSRAALQFMGRLDLGTGNPEKPDEIFGCMLDAADTFQCANFLFLHGYYRAAMAELRVALGLVMIGTVIVRFIR